MNITIEMNSIEFIIASVVGPIVAMSYFLLKIWIKRKIKNEKIIRSK